MCLLYLAHPPGFAQLDVAALARVGDVPPGVPGFEFINFRGPAVSSGSGNVAFAATIRREISPGVFEFKTGAWVWHAGGLKLVALQGDPIPGGAAGEVLGHFFPAAAGEASQALLNVNDLGQVAWRGFVAGTGVTADNDTALFVAGPSYPSLQMPAREGTQVPGAAAGQLFLNFAFAPLPLNDAGQILFYAVENGPEGAKQGFWSGMPGDPRPIVKAGDPAPGGATFSAPSNSATINNLGVVAAQLNSSDVATRGIWTATPDEFGGFELLQIASHAAAEFFNTADPTINDAGQVAFREGTFGLQAVWRWTPDSPPVLERIVKEGDPAPGTAASFKTFVGRPLVNAMGQVVFRAQLSTSQFGLWIGTPGTTSLVALPGEPAPGTALTFGGVGQGAINGGGTSIFQGTDEEANGFWAGPTSGLQLILRDQSPGNEIRFEDGSICAIGFRTLGSRRYSSGNEDGLPGILSDTGQIALSGGVTGCGNAVYVYPRPGNEAPTADAGEDQSATRGVPVQLDGSASFDDNTAAADLLYDWTLQVPLGSSSFLTGASTDSPTFTPDVLGEYVATLTVTDEGGLTDQDEVLVSTENMAPTASAGVNMLIPVGQAAILDGSGSTDPENDALSFDWSLDAQPAGSVAVIDNADKEMASITPDLAGDYLISLIVTDAFGATSPPSLVTYTATAEPLPEDQILDAGEIVFNLTPEQVTTRGNQVAFLNHLRQAVAAIQIGDIDEAIHKLETSITRTDGCPERGAVDGKGPGRDWIVDCAAQLQVHPLLVSALDTLSD